MIKLSSAGIFLLALGGTQQGVSATSKDTLSAPTNNLDHHRQLPGNLGGKGSGRDSGGETAKLSGSCILTETDKICLSSDGVSGVPCGEEVDDLDAARAQGGNSNTGGGKRHYACEDSATGLLYSIDDADSDAITEALKGNSPNFEKDPSGQKMASGNTLFEGDADLDPATGKISLKSGKFSKNENPRKVGGRGGGQQGKLGKLGGGLNNAKGNSRRNRNLQWGEAKVLAIRVVTAGDSPPKTVSYTSTELANAVFGTLVGGDDTCTLASQYAKCSADEYLIQPGPYADMSDGTSLTPETVTNIVNGVATVTIPLAAAAGTDSVQLSVTSAINAAFDVTSPSWLADHVMYCIPDDPSYGNFIAGAALNHWASVFNDEWCLYPSTQMHEIGHNLGLHHSGEGSSEYGDWSGVMGASFSGNEKNICFNGPKNYNTGWFWDREIDLDAAAGESFEGPLYGQVMYADTVETEDAMIIRISKDGCGASGCDLYVSFNAATRHNSDTQEGQDMVLVHTKADEWYETAPSFLVAKLPANSYTFFDMDTHMLMVRVGDIDVTAGYADVYVGPPVLAEEAGATEYYTACGGSDKACAGTTSAQPVESVHEVRCCSDTPGEGWMTSTSNTCSDSLGRTVYAKSQFGGAGVCKTGTLAEADAICIMEGGRLCTGEELLNDCLVGTPCSSDPDMIWSSTPGNIQFENGAQGCTSHADCMDSGECTLDTCDALTGQCSHVPLEGCGKVLQCGGGTVNGVCRSNPTLSATDMSEIHEVRCCSETDPGGWMKKSHCSVYGASEINGQCHTANYDGAVEICESVGTRLCTKDELANSCLAGSGCGWDNEHIWTSTLNTCTSHEECEDGVGCTTNTCNPDTGSCVTELTESCLMVTACGGGNGDTYCGGVYDTIADPSDLHHVSCCSETSKSGWKSAGTCSVWGDSKYLAGGCQASKTWHEAKQICADNGARLCTKEEVMSACVFSTGCNFSWGQVWTSSLVDSEE